MLPNDATDAPVQWTAFNYCISFIDLLGQRDALKGQGLLPTSEEDLQNFNKILKNSIGAIWKLQDRANSMLSEALKSRPDSPFRTSLPTEQQAIWDEMSQARVKTQAWSDGMVYFVCLGDADIKCHLNGIFSMFALVGSLCFMGLASRQPIRGAIDVAWGVELQPGELYGAAVARAYELESIHAQYPRIIVGPRAIACLKAHQENQDQDVYSENNRALAQLCLKMLIQDVDGIWILHYLGDEFRQAVTHAHHDELYAEAHKYIEEQLQKYQQSHNSKLAFRYSHLLWYFDAHQPSPGTK